MPYEQEDVVSYDGNQFYIVSALPPGDITESGVEYANGVGATSATQLTAAGTTGTAITIAGGQLYATGGSGNISAVGAGLPTTGGQSLTGLPNLQNEYQNYYNTAPRSPEQVLLLNTTDGTTNNPNVAYVADQDFGLLKFYLNNASITLMSSGTTATATVASGSLAFLGNGKDQVQITGAGAYNGIYTISNINGSGGSGTTFTFTTTGSNLASTTATAGQWLSGQNGTGVFGQKLVFAGGATGVTGNVTFNGSGQYTGVQLYVTGANQQGITPNDFVYLDDTNAASAGFPSGNFVLEAIDGSSGAGGGTFNANANFAGIAFVPGAVTTTTLTSTGATTYGNNVTFTATVTSPVDTPAGTVTFYYGTTALGTTALNGSGVATFTTTSPLPVGGDAISAVYNPGGSSLATDDVSTGTLTQTINYTPGDLIVDQVGFSSNIASVAVNGTTVTVTTTNPLPFALNATGLVLTVNGNSGANVNGTFAITLTGQNSFTYTAPATPTVGTGGTVSVGSSVGVTATTVAASGGITTVTVTTSASSGFTRVNW